MNTLIVIFAFMAVYGLFVGKTMAGIVSLGGVVLLIYGKRELRKRDIEFYLHPRSAKKPKPDGPDALAEQECESSRDKL